MASDIENHIIPKGRQAPKVCRLLVPEALQAVRYEPRTREATQGGRSKAAPIAGYTGKRQQTRSSSSEDRGFGRPMHSFLSNKMSVCPYIIHCRP